MSNEKKDKPQMGFREAFLSSKKYKSKKVKWNGYEVVLKELTGKQRGNVYSASMVTKSKRGSDEVIQEVDQTKLTVWAVIYQTYFANTDAKVFTEADFDALAALPGSALDVLAKPALELLGEDVEEAEKN